MRVVIGGAYNGKEAYVRQQLITSDDYEWVAGKFPANSGQKLVWTHLHECLRDFPGSDQEAIDLVLQTVANVEEVIVVLTDNSRGIVPVDPEERRFRDRCGRIYQAIVAEASEVIQVWYGIGKKIK